MSGGTADMSAIAAAAAAQSAAASALQQLMAQVPAVQPAAAPPAAAPAAPYIPDERMVRMSLKASPLRGQYLQSAQRAGCGAPSGPWAADHAARGPACRALRRPRPPCCLSIPAHHSSTTEPAKPGAPLLQVFNCTPQQLLPLVRAELERLLQQSPSLVEGYIRPGEQAGMCTGCNCLHLPRLCRCTLCPAAASAAWRSGGANPSRAEPSRSQPSMPTPAAPAPLPALPPGCVHLTLNLLLGRQEAAALSAHGLPLDRLLLDHPSSSGGGGKAAPTGSSQAPGCVAAPSAGSGSGTTWRHLAAGRMIVQVSLPALLQLLPPGRTPLPLCLGVPLKCCASLTLPLPASPPCHPRWDPS